MGWFNGPKKLSLPGFVVNAFGKLPFYKEYLYLCPDPAFGDLKAWVDDRFERLSRKETRPPYLAPNRHFMIHVPSHKTDLVGSIWESNDGLRTFPFMLATALPKKARKHGFPLFWQTLSDLWDYFERYYLHLRDTGSSSAFYRGIRGVEHQIPKVVAPQWPKDAALNHEARDDLERGGLARYNLRSNSPDLETWLGGLQLNSCPNLVLWPQSDYAAMPYRAMGYLSLLGIEALAIDLFQPFDLEGEGLKKANALAHGAAIAAKVDSVVDLDTSEEITLILGDKGKPEGAGGDPEEDSLATTVPVQVDQEPITLNLPPLGDEMEAIEAMEASTDIDTAEDVDTEEDVETAEDLDATDPGLVVAELNPDTLETDTLELVALKETLGSAAEVRELPRGEAQYGDPEHHAFVDKDGLSHENSQDEPSEITEDKGDEATHNFEAVTLSAIEKVDSVDPSEEETQILKIPPEIQLAAEDEFNKDTVEDLEAMDMNTLPGPERNLGNTQDFDDEPAANPEEVPKEFKKSPEDELLSLDPEFNHPQTPLERDEDSSRDD